MTKIRQKRFSNGKIQNQHKSLTLKEFKALSLADAYAIVSGYKEIPAKSSELRIRVYKHALEMVQKHDAQFAKKAKSKPNPEIKKSLVLTDAYNIVGGYLPADEKTFKQAIELLKNDKSDPEFAALVIKFAESHMPFSDADNETLAKVNEEGLSFFDNLDIKKVVKNVSENEEVQQAFNATPVAAKTETPKAEELINEIAQEGIIYSAATKAMEMPQSANDENAFEEEVQKQTTAQIISLRLEAVNKDRDEAVIEAIKSNSEKPLSTFCKKMKNAWDFTKKISISQESVKNVCDKAAAKWNKYTKKASIATKTAIASTEYLIQELTPRNMKAACLAGVMSVSLFFSSCSNSGDTKALTQQEIEAQKKAAEEKAKAASFAEAQKKAAEEKAKVEAAKKAHRDSIMNMAVPHEWNDSTMRTIRGQAELDKIMNYYNKEDSACYDRLYRNLELASDSLPMFQHNGDSVATKVDNEAVMKRLFQQLQFQYGVQLDADGNPVVDKKGNPVYEERQAYIVAQNVVQILDRPCDGQEFNPEDVKQSDLQLLFDTAIPVDPNGRIVDNPYMHKTGCGEDVKSFGTVRTPKEEKKEVAEDNTTTVLSDSVETKKDSLALGIANINYEEVNQTKIGSVSLGEQYTSTDTNGKPTAVTPKGDVTVGTAVKIGENAAQNDDKVFASANGNQVAAKTTITAEGNDSTNTSTATSTIVLGVAGDIKSDTASVDGHATNLTVRNVSTDGKGDVTAVTNQGTTTADDAIKAGKNAAKNASNVYTDATSTTATTYSSTTTSEIKLGVSGNDAASVADSVKNVQADSAFTSTVSDNAFTLKQDTIGWNILRPENGDSIPEGTPAAFGEMSGRGGFNYSSISKEAYQGNLDYYGPEFYEAGRTVYDQHPEISAKGGAAEGRTYDEYMFGLRKLMQWSVKKNSDFAKFRPEILDMMNFVKGCDTTFSAEAAARTRQLLDAVHVNGSVDNVIGRTNVRNPSYTAGKDCDEKGKATFNNTNYFGPTYPSGEYLEKVYAMPRTAPALQLGISNSTYEEINQIDFKDVKLTKRYTSTNSTGKTIATTNKGKATVTDATNAGNKAAKNNSTVYAQQEIR